MKLLNLSKNSIFISDIGNARNKGTSGRSENQARYIPSSLDENGDLDPTKTVQLIETDAVLMSAASGHISKLISLGLAQVVSVGEDVEGTVSTTKAATNTQVFWNDFVFDRPVKLTAIKVFPNIPPDTGNALYFQIKKNNHLPKTVTHPTAPTVALKGTPAAGNLSNGVYYYLVTFVTATGETDAGIVSASVEVTDNGTNGQVDISGIPTGVVGVVTARNIYRTLVDADPDTDPFYLLYTISNNSGSTYTDNIADATIGPLGTNITPPATNETGLLYEYNENDVGEKVIDVSHIIFPTNSGETTDNVWDADDTLDLILFNPTSTGGESLSTDSTGISTIKTTLVFTETD